MKNKKWNVLVYLHAGLLLWALLFLGNLFMRDSSKLIAVLGMGNFFFLFINIPFSAVSFALKAKKCFDEQYEVPVVILSILNTVVGIAAWYCLVLLLQKP